MLSARLMDCTTRTTLMSPFRFSNSAVLLFLFFISLIMKHGSFPKTLCPFFRLINFLAFDFNRFKCGS